MKLKILIIFLSSKLNILLFLINISICTNNSLIPSAPITNEINEYEERVSLLTVTDLNEPQNSNPLTPLTKEEVEQLKLFWQQVGRNSIVVDRNTRTIKTKNNNLHLNINLKDIEIKDINIDIPNSIFYKSIFLNFQNINGMGDKRAIDNLIFILKKLRYQKIDWMTININLYNYELLSNLSDYDLSAIQYLKPIESIEESYIHNIVLDGNRNGFLYILKIINYIPEFRNPNICIIKNSTNNIDNILNESDLYKYTDKIRLATNNSNDKTTQNLQDIYDNCKKLDKKRFTLEHNFKRINYIHNFNFISKLSSSYDSLSFDDKFDFTLIVKINFSSFENILNVIFNTDFVCKWKIVCKIVESDIEQFNLLKDTYMSHTNGVTILSITFEFINLNITNNNNIKTIIISSLKAFSHIKISNYQPNIILNNINNQLLKQKLNYIHFTTDSLRQDLFNNLPRRIIKIKIINSTIANKIEKIINEKQIFLNYYKKELVTKDNLFLMINLNDLNKILSSNLIIESKYLDSYLIYNIINKIIVNKIHRCNSCNKSILENNYNSNTLTKYIFISDFNRVSCCKCAIKAISNHHKQYFNITNLPNSYSIYIGVFTPNRNQSKYFIDLFNEYSLKELLSNELLDFYYWMIY